jgi:hypothetical protein
MMGGTGMSDAISLNLLEGIATLNFVGGMESRQQNQDRQRMRGSGVAGGADSARLSPEAEKQLRTLRGRDQELRAHEQADTAAGGQYVSVGAARAAVMFPLYGASWQSGAGNGAQAASASPGQPWPGQERAAAIYAAMQGISQSALAPYGTGIHLTV